MTGARHPSTTRSRTIQAPSRFRRNIVRIASGTIASQAIVIGATPLLTRRYGPEDFGALAVFSALHAIVLGLFTLKYDLSIILPREQGKALVLAVLTISISLMLSLSLLAVLGAGHFGFGVPSHRYYLLLPLSAVLGAAYTCAQQWGARAGDYRLFSRGQVVNAVANVGTSLLLAALAGGLFGSLVVGFVTGLAAGCAYIGFGLLRARSGQRAPAPRIADLVDAAKEYRRFPLFVLPSSSLATLGLSAQPFILQAMFSLAEVGQYAIASRFLLVPGSLIGGAVAEAFRPELVDRLKRGLEVRTFLRQTLAKLLLFALPVFVTLFLTAPPLFAFVFGATFHDAGVLARYLCIGALAQFISQPFVYVFVATGQVRLGLVVQTTTTALPLIGIVIGGLSGHMEHALLLSSLMTLVSSTLMVGLAYRCCAGSDRAGAGGTGDAPN